MTDVSLVPHYLHPPSTWLNSKTSIRLGRSEFGWFNIRQRRKLWYSQQTFMTFLVTHRFFRSCSFFLDRAPKQNSSSGDVGLIVHTTHNLSCCRSFDFDKGWNHLRWGNRNPNSTVSRRFEDVEVNILLWKVNLTCFDKYLHNGPKISIFRISHGPTLISRGFEFFAEIRMRTSPSKIVRTGAVWWWASWVW